MKVCVALPAQDIGHTTFWMCLINAMFFHKETKDIDIVITQQNGCYLDLLRNQLVQSALKTNPDYILMLDTDMVFPIDTIARLVRHNKEVIGCNYTQRRPPFYPLAMTFENYNQRVNPMESTGISAVSILPTGIMLIKPSIFQRIKYPWFENIWRKSDNRLVGEDVVFCAKVQEEAKAQVFCDHDLSKEIGHSGQFDYTIPMICGKETI